MQSSEKNRFQDFFVEDRYITFKNLLYNYQIRKISVEKTLKNEKIELILEVGSGISPVMTRSDRIVFSDVSFTALNILKQRYGKGEYVVAGLPFKQGVFSHTVGSELFEHLQDDKGATKEIARVMKPAGRIIITFPHKKSYYAIDDRFVNHFRRYELNEMNSLLIDSGFKPVYIQKVLGPLEKVTMSIVVICYSLILKLRSEKSYISPNYRLLDMFKFCFKWVNKLYMLFALMDVRIMPLSLSSVILIKAILFKRNHNIG